MFGWFLSFTCPFYLGVFLTKKMGAFGKRANKIQQHQRSMGRPGCTAGVLGVCPFLFPPSFLTHPLPNIGQGHIAEHIGPWNQLPHFGGGGIAEHKLYQFVVDDVVVDQEIEAILGPPIFLPRVDMMCAVVAGGGWTNGVYTSLRKASGGFPMGRLLLLGPPREEGDLGRHPISSGVALG